MKTRAIAAHLNGQGFTVRGKPFLHSNVDGVLTREHYVGRYLDRTADDAGETPSDADAIVVPCPKLIDPELVTRVAARRAKAAPRVPPPRITNSPVLLTGSVNCGTDGCGSGLAIRTGKGGQYSYFTCNAKITAGAGACSAKAIRQDALDRIVMDTLLDTVLQPSRLKELLAEVLERSDEADERRRGDLDRVRRERVATEGRLRRFYGIVEEQLTDPRDPVFADRASELQGIIAQLGANERSLAMQLKRRKLHVDEAAVERFGSLVRERMRTDSAFPRGYTRLFISDGPLPTTASASRERGQPSKPP